MNEIVGKVVHGDSTFRGILALICIASGVFMVMSEKPVPEWFQLTFGVVIVFYFGSGAIQMIRDAIQKKNGDIPK